MTAPGAVPLTDRAPAPDVARGAMLLLIALANVHLYLYGHPLGVRFYPADPTGADAVVTALQLALVDGRAYPLFGLLFGYGIGQLAARRTAAGAADAVALVRRRGWWLLAIGAVHAVLLWSGDIAGAYGLLAVLLGGLLVAGTAVSLLTTAAVGTVTAVFLESLTEPAGPDASAALPSVAAAEPAGALALRAAEWPSVLVSSVLSVFGAVALGAWTARHRVLDEPGRYRGPLRRVAAAGLAAAVLLGLPLALAGAGVWRPGAAVLPVVGALHGLGGYAGGLGYAAVFGLLVSRSGPVLRALAACGQRSLSCYLGQSVLFVVLLPAWTLRWGARLGVAQAALLAVAVWLVLLLGAVACARTGYRGPAEVLLRRLTYGPGAGATRRRAAGPAPPAPR